MTRQIMHEARLINGDSIKIGQTIFKFISGQDVEARYYEEIYRMTIIDGLTQVYVKRYLLESLDKELIRAGSLAHDLSLLMVDIDHLRKINEVHGHLAGDYVLKEVARLVQQRIRRDEVLARYGGGEFAVILPLTTCEAARALAEGLRERIEQSRFVFEGEMIRVTISIGGSIVQDGDRAGLDLVERANEKLYEAKRAGRNSVSVGPSLGHRPVLDGTALLERMRLDGFARALVAFEIDGETTIIERYGVHTFEASLRELLRIVELGTESRDILGTWRERYVLASVRLEAVDQVLCDVHTQWDGLRPSPADPTHVQRLRHSALSPDEVSKFGDRALVILISRLEHYVSDLLSSTFISYGDPDQAFARRLYEALQKSGVTTFFFPESAIPGEKLHRVMRKGVNEHDRVILVCSRASLEGVVLILTLAAAACAASSASSG